MTLSQTNLAVTYNGPFLSYSGFSKMNREIALRLALKGVSVRTDIIDTKIEVDHKTEDRIKRLSKTQLPSGSPVIYGMTMPSIMGNNGPRILFTMMETSKEVHPEYVERCNLASEVWVPTSHMKDALEASGIAVPVYTIPLGVDTSVFRSDIQPMRLPSDAKSFKFLSVFWWGIRKGYDILIRAYVNEFSGSEDVSLVISSKGHDLRTTTGIANEIKSIVKSVGKKDSPSIILQGTPLTDAKMASLYKACNAFALPSRGEGMGLPLLEAAACGLPIITTRCTAQATYLDDSMAYLVDPEGYERANPMDGRPTNVGRWCKYYENQFFPVLRGAAIRQLGSHMRRVYENREEASSKSELFTTKVISFMTWDHTVAKIINRLSDCIEV
jgi:hypothetical protein